MWRDFKSALYCWQLKRQVEYFYARPWVVSSSPPPDITFNIKDRTDKRSKKKQSNTDLKE
jgi:hypothetical protein